MRSVISLIDSSARAVRGGEESLQARHKFAKGSRTLGSRREAASALCDDPRDGHLRRDRPRRHEDPGGRSSTTTTTCSAPRGTRRRRAAARRTSRRRWRTALREAAERRRSSSRPRWPGSASARRARSKTATSRARATCPAGKAPSRSPTTLEDALGPPASRSATTCRSRPTPSSSSAPGGSTTRCSASSGAPGVGGGLILDGKPWTGRGGAGEIGHMVVKIDGARCTCGRRGCVEAYAGRAAMEAHVRKLQVEKGDKTDLFKLMKRARTHAPDERHLGAGARARRQARDADDRARGRGRSAPASPRPSTCSTSRRVILGGGLGVRLGDPYAKRIAEAMQPHLFADSRPPHVHVAALGDLGGAIGATLLRREHRAARRRRRASRAPSRERSLRGPRR